jgi:hypothetical protein
MAFRSDSVAGFRFLAAVHEGRGIEPAARSVGVHPWTGYRWLREAFLALRSNGFDVEAAQADLGCFTAKAQVWEEEFLAGLGDGRHHSRGTGCASAMVTLRERKTQYGIVINLPDDHTAATVNQAGSPWFARQGAERFPAARSHRLSDAPAERFGSSC